KPVGDKPPDTYAARIWSFFQGREDLWRTLELDGAPEAAARSTDRSAGVPEVDVEVDRVLDERRRWIEARDAVLAPQRTPRVVSATTVARMALGDDAVDAADREDAELEAGLDAAELEGDRGVQPRRRGRAGTAIGRAVHATLQVLDLQAPREVEAQVRRQCDLEFITEHEPTVAALVHAALASPAVQQAAKHPHHKELFVSAPIGERVIEGYVDLLVESPEGLVVVDYKTDTVPNEAAIDEKLATYELQ